MKLFREFKDGVFKIRNQIVFLLFFITVLPIFFVQMYNYSATNRKLQMKDAILLEDNLILTTSLLNNTLSAYKQLFFQLATDTTCINTVTQMNEVSEDSVQYLRLSDVMTTVIRSNMMMRPEIKAVGVISDRGSAYLYAEERESTESVIRYFQENKEALKEQVMTSDTLFFHMISVDDSSYNEKYPCFFLANRLMDYGNLKVVGALFLFIDPSKISREINNPTSHTFLYSDKLLLDGTDHLVCSRDVPGGYAFSGISEYEDINLSALEDGKSMRQGDYLFSVSYVDHFNLKLLNIVDYRLLHRDLNTLWLRTLVTILLILIGSLFGAFFLCRGFVGSLERMARRVDQVDEEHLNISMDINCRNEIQVIGKSVDRMLALIRNLLEENRRQYEHIVEITKAACEAELKSMELQINPHFLFNTIDSINWLAIREDCRDVSEQLNRLAYILRYTVYDMNKVVPIESEIRWLLQYLELQKIRFDHSFSYDVYIEPGTGGLQIHKLLLQPFLENSLIHGFEGISWKGKLGIRFQMLGREEQYLLICIEDNGTGMTKEQTDTLNRFFWQKTETFQGIGLSNIFYRLRNYYPGHRLMVTSARGMTVFKLFIPVGEMEGAHVQNTDRRG
jgi:two-component system sensor histidine kinase YesM